MTYVQLSSRWRSAGPGSATRPTSAMLGGAALIIAGGLWLWRSQKAGGDGRAGERRI